MRRIPLRRKPHAPIVKRRDRLVHVMEILALGVDEFAESAGAVDLPHRVAGFVERGGLEHHVRQPAGVDRFVQLRGIVQRAEHGRHRRGHVLAVLEDLDAMPEVAWGVSGYEDGLQRVVFDQLLQRRIRLFATAGLGQPLASFGDQVADGRHRDVGMILEAELRAELADAEADDAHAELVIGDGLPDSFRALGCLDAGFAQYLLIGGLGFGGGEPSAGRSRASKPMPTCCRKERREAEVFMAGSLKAGPGGPSAARRVRNGSMRNSMAEQAAGHQTPSAAPCNRGGLTFQFPTGIMALLFHTRGIL